MISKSVKAFSFLSIIFISSTAKPIIEQQQEMFQREIFQPVVRLNEYINAPGFEQDRRIAPGGQALRQLKELRRLSKIALTRIRQIDSDPNAKISEYFLNIEELKSFEKEIGLENLEIIAADMHDVYFGLHFQNLIISVLNLLKQLDTYGYNVSEIYYSGILQPINSYTINFLKSNSPKIRTVISTKTGGLLILAALAAEEAMVGLSSLNYKNVNLEIYKKIRGLSCSLSDFGETLTTIALSSDRLEEDFTRLFLCKHKKLKVGPYLHRQFYSILDDIISICMFVRNRFTKFGTLPIPLALGQLIQQTGFGPQSDIPGFRQEVPPGVLIGLDENNNPIYLDERDPRIADEMAAPLMSISAVIRNGIAIAEAADARFFGATA